MAGSTGRQTWMDLLRGLAVLLIVVNHAAVSVEELGVAVPAAVETVNLLLAPFRIPMLVFLSGLLLGGSLRKGAEPYLEGKLSNIAWPYLVWLVPHAALKEDPDPIRVLLGDTQLWFLLFLGFYYVLALVLRWVPPPLLVAGALVASAVAPGGEKYGERLWLLFAIFMLGHWAASTDLWPRVVDVWWVLAGSVVVLGVYLVTADAYAYGLESLVAVAAGVVVLCSVARRVAPSRWTAPLRFLGRDSLVVYVSHAVGLHLVGLVAAGRGWTSAPWLFAAFAVVGVALPVVLVLVKQRWLPARYLFTLTPRGGPLPLVTRLRRARGAG